MFNRNTSLAAYLLMLSCVSSAEEPQDDFFDLSLEALGDIEIISSSRQKETVAESAAIVSVLTQSDLQNLGANTLYEALGYVPGVSITETYYGYSSINVRGTLQTHYNNKVLIMINDHPTFETITGGSHLEFMPIHMVERVEIIRGPGSALYGTNALAGVINIITREDVDVNGTEFYARGGSNDHGYGELITKTGPLLISASVQKDNGYDYGGTVDELGQSVDLDYENDLANLFVDFSVQNFRLNMGYFNQTKMKYGVVPRVEQSGAHEFTAYYIDAKNRWHFDSGVLTARIRRDENTRTTDSGWLGDPFTPNRDNYYSTLKSKTEMWAFDINYQWLIQDGMTLISGFELEHDKSEPFIATFQDTGEFNQLSPYYNSIQTTNKSVFTQWKWQATDNFSMLAGMRLNDNEDAGTSDLVPRLGAVYGFSERTTIKLLYGEAYRNPDYLERYSESAIIRGDSGLERETIKTLDLGLDHQWGKTVLRLNGFYQQLEDGIVRQPPLNGQSAMYVNGDEVKIWGVESELKFALSNALSGFVNISYKEGEDNDGNGLEFIEHVQGNASLLYKHSERWTFSGSAQYMGDKAYTTTTNESGDIDDYWLVNGHVSYKPSERYSITGKVKNLFDQSYSYPEYVRKRLVETPGGPDRSYYLEAAFFFD